MKSELTAFFALLAWAMSPMAEAQLSYMTNDGTIVITGYSGGGAVSIPTNINGLTVTVIADNAFSGSSVTSVCISTIPNGRIMRNDFTASVRLDPA
jgi:hypothetical protein